MNQGLSPGVFAEQAPRDGMLGQGNGPRGNYVDPYQAFNIGGRPETGYAQPQTDPFASHPTSNYGFLDPSAPEYGVGSGNIGRMGATQNDWASNFQGLSLGS